MGRRAPLPGPEQLEQRLQNRAEARAQAAPGSRDGAQAPGVMNTYRVNGNRICHGKKKGDLVDLWDTGATRALVQAGHLTEVVEEKDQAAESAN